MENPTICHMIKSKVVVTLKTKVCVFICVVKGLTNNIVHLLAATNKVSIC